MDIIILGAGMMGRAIAYDLLTHSAFDTITLLDNSDTVLKSAQTFISSCTTQNNIKYINCDVTNNKEIRRILLKYDIAISAVNYNYNLRLAKLAIKTGTHFLDLGGNTDIMKKELDLFEKAAQQKTIIIPDCGLAPGMTSIITKHIVEQLDTADSVKLRVGGLPQHDIPPLGYTLLFSPYGLINEYVEESIILEDGQVVSKPSMTGLETINFPSPFGELEAFLTSGGTSMLPYTYKDSIKNLDYKTIRYPGHCKKFKVLLDMGLAREKPINVNGKQITPRDLLATILRRKLPNDEPDVVLLKTVGKGSKNHHHHRIEYSMIDYYDEEHNITAMMRTTGYPTAIIADMIEKETITTPGVHTPGRIVPTECFFSELKKRGITVAIDHRGDPS